MSNLLQKRLPLHAMLTVGLLSLLISGCGPTLSVKKTIEIDSGEIRTVLLDPVGQAQTIKVEASAAEPFHVHIHLAGDEDAVDLAIASGKESDKIITGESNVKSASLTAEIPANKEATVRFQSAGSGKNSVSYTISN